MKARSCQLNGYQSAYPLLCSLQDRSAIYPDYLPRIRGSLMISLYYYYRTKILKNHLERTTQQLREDKKKLEESEIELRDAKERAEELIN